MSRQEDHSVKRGAEGGAAAKAATASKGKRGRRRKGMCLEDRPVLEANAAGIDIGAREVFVAVPPDRDENPVRVFATFTEDLVEMARWLTTVASPRWRWSPPGFIGFHFMRCWNNTA